MSIHLTWWASLFNICWASCKMFGVGTQGLHPVCPTTWEHRVLTVFWSLSGPSWYLRGKPVDIGWVSTCHSGFGFARKIIVVLSVNLSCLIRVSIGSWWGDFTWTHSSEHFVLLCICHLSWNQNSANPLMTYSTSLEEGISACCKPKLPQALAQFCQEKQIADLPPSCLLPLAIWASYRNHSVPSKPVTSLLREVGGTVEYFIHHLADNTAQSLPTGWWCPRLLCTSMEKVTAPHVWQAPAIPQGGLLLFL